MDGRQHYVRAVREPTRGWKDKGKTLRPTMLPVPIKECEQ
jgi:hypothetical protein